MPTLQAIHSADVHTNADLAVAVKNSASPSSQYNLPVVGISLVTVAHVVQRHS
jgi:hypothetical protein